MSDGFKKGFIITLGVMAAIVIVGWAMKLLLWKTSNVR